MPALQDFSGIFITILKLKKLSSRTQLGLGHALFVNIDSGFAAINVCKEVSLRQTVPFNLSKDMQFALKRILHDRKEQNEARCCQGLA